MTAQAGTRSKCTRQWLSQRQRVPLQNNLAVGTFRFILGNVVCHGLGDGVGAASILWPVDLVCIVHHHISEELGAGCGDAAESVASSGEPATGARAIDTVIAGLVGRCNRDADGVVGKTIQVNSREFRVTSSPRRVDVARTIFTAMLAVSSPSSGLGVEILMVEPTPPEGNISARSCTLDAGDAFRGKVAEIK